MGKATEKLTAAVLLDLRALSDHGLGDDQLPHDVDEAVEPVGAHPDGGLAGLAASLLGGLAIGGQSRNGTFQSPGDGTEKKRTRTPVVNS